MNASVTATEMLKFVTWVRSSLQVMNSRMSGWSTRRIPMLAPRRGGPLRPKEGSRRGRRPAAGRRVARTRGGEGARAPPEQVLRPLDGGPVVVFDQVAPLEHGDGVGGQVRHPLAGGSGHACSSLCGKSGPRTARASV